MSFKKVFNEVIAVSAPDDGKDYEYDRFRGGLVPKRGKLLNSPDDYAVASAKNIQKALTSIQNAIRCIPGAKDNSLSTWIPRLKSLQNELGKFPKFR